MFHLVHKIVIQVHRFFRADKGHRRKHRASCQNGRQHEIDQSFHYILLPSRSLFKLVLLNSSSIHSFPACRKRLQFNYTKMISYFQSKQLWMHNAGRQRKPRCYVNVYGHSIRRVSLRRKSMISIRWTAWRWRDQKGTSRWMISPAQIRSFPMHTALPASSRMWSKHRTSLSENIHTMMTRSIQKGFKQHDVLLNYPEFGDHLIIGKFCQIA